MELHDPTPEDIARAWNEGRDAAVNGLTFRDHCPYTYNNFPGMTYEEFNRAKRELMNSWFWAWQEYRP